MTVASLWKVLDAAGCGVAIGVQDLIDPTPDHARLVNSTNPWNYNQSNHHSLMTKPPALAVDLSIWICEALTSQAASANNKNPAIYLAYTRAIKLLSLGVKLVIVIEGKRRLRRTHEPDTFRKRRAGTVFWQACKACEQMFECLGVPVVKAKAEGEALCALLNLRGVVDGVISNDGDCLLFGAKVVYTKFSIENLQNSQVIRYDASNCAAIVDDENDEHREEAKSGMISLSRLDLIAFAILTGSDLAGNGLPKIGHKKAVRFLYKCKHDHPLSTETSAVDELNSWAKAATSFNKCGFNKDVFNENKERCCSICCHAGDKKSHMEKGCETCGTEPGEPCFQFSSSDRFRESLRANAMAQKPAFAPRMVVDAYLKPNDNSMPLMLEGASSQTLEMGVPNIQALLALNLIIKGQSHDTSRDFVFETLSRLLVRRELFGAGMKTRAEPITRVLNKVVPDPVKVTRQLVRDQVLCLEVAWRVQASLTDSEGNDIDGYEFSTIESKELIMNRYPDLVLSFQEAEVEQRKQGDAEWMKRKEFIESFLQRNADCSSHQVDGKCHENRKRAGKKKRNQEGFFEGRRAKKYSSKKRARVEVGQTEEMKAMMRQVGGEKKRPSNDYDYSTIASEITIHLDKQEAKKTKQYGRPKVRSYHLSPLGMTITVVSASMEPISCLMQPGTTHSVAEISKFQCIDRVLNHERVQPHSSIHGKAKETKLESSPERIVDRPGQGEGSSWRVKTSSEDYATTFLDRDKSDRQSCIMSFERQANPCSQASVAEVTDEIRHHQDIGSSLYTQLSLDPDAWMAKIVVGAFSNFDREPKVNRRLDFDDCWHGPAGCDAIEMPALTPGQCHNIVCDMGIPILVSPLLARKVN